MKRWFFSLAVLLSVITIQAQGTVNFNNYVPSLGIDAPVYDVDQVTRLSGTNYFFQIYGSSQDTGAQSLPLGEPVTFGTGEFAGYILPGSDTVRTIPGIEPGGRAAVFLRVWEAQYPTWEDAVAAEGHYSNFAMGLSSTGNPVADPPTPPVYLTSMHFFHIPEPSTMALVLFGGVALVMRRRWIRK